MKAMRVVVKHTYIFGLERIPVMFSVQDLYYCKETNLGYFNRRISCMIYLIHSVFLTVSSFDGLR